MYYLIWGYYLIGKYDNKGSAIEARNDDQWSTDIEVVEQHEAIRQLKANNGLIKDQTKESIDTKSELIDLPCSPDPYKYRRAISK